jgi:hypothetical protein
MCSSHDLARRGHHVLVLGVPEQHGRGGKVVVMIVVGLQLIPPPQGARARIEHQRTVGEEIGAVTVTRCEVRHRIADGRKELRGDRIERQRRPRGPAPVRRPLRIAPGVGADFLTERNRVEAPHLAAGQCVVRQYPAANAELPA